MNKRKNEKAEFPIIRMNEMNKEGESIKCVLHESSKKEEEWKS